jgi:3-deoxy-D-manno-octulosonic-acid transferase
MSTERPIPLPCGLALAAYALATNVLFPPLAAMATPLLLFKAKRRRTLLPRFGFQAYPRLTGGCPAPVWVHALSVGELLSAVPLIRGLKTRLKPRPVVVSVSTLAARKLADARLGGTVDGLFYFPYDTAIAYRRCVARIRPALFLLVETDLWPGYLRHLRARGVPCWLVNGRLSPKSFAQRRRWACLFGPTLDCFERVYGQSPAENDRFRCLGVTVDRLGQPGNLKYDACGPAPTPEAVAQLRSDLGYADDGPVLLAGSTHAGEEAIVRRAFLRLRSRIPRLKLVLVPRHQERAAEVQALWVGDGIAIARMTDRRHPAPDVLVVDEIGHLGRLYGLCAVAFVGGSLAGKGGQNPIEPAMAARPILFGPDMSSFPEVAPELATAGGAVTVRNETEFVDRCLEWLVEPARAEVAGQAARRVVSAHAGVTARLVEAAACRLGQPSSAHLDG